MGYSGSNEMFKTNNPINLLDINPRPFKQSGLGMKRMKMVDGRGQGAKMLIINPMKYPPY